VGIKRVSALPTITIGIVWSESFLIAHFGCRRCLRLRHQKIVHCSIVWRLAKIHIHSSSAVKLQEHLPFRRGLAQSQRPLVFHVIISDGAQLVPEIQASGDGCANANADQQEPAVGGHPDRGCRHDRRRNYQSRRASDRNCHKNLVDPSRQTVASVWRAPRSTSPRQLYYLREQW
jgi:hypothetical protein